MTVSNLHQAVIAGAAGAGGGFTIDNSVMLSDGNTERFNKTFSQTPSSQKKFTIAGWYKRTSWDKYDIFFGGVGASATAGRVQAYTHSNGRIVYEMYHGSGWNAMITDQVFTDVNAWYHIMFVMDIMNPTAADRMRIYVNNERATIDTSGAGGAITHSYITNTGLNHLVFSNSQPMEIGDSGDNNVFDGYMAEVIGLDGRALTTMTDFGEYDDNGYWIPKDPTDALTVSETAEAIVNTTSAVSGSDTAAYTFSSVALGTASTTRAVYVWTSGQGPSVSAFNVNTMTVGGVSASLVQVADSSVEPQYMGELWRADVPSGTTGDIVVTWNSALSQCGISVWSVTGDHEEFAIATDLSNSTSSVSFTNVPDNSVILAGRGSTSSVTHTWSADVTENVDQTIEGSVTHSAASKFHATGGSKTVECTPSGSDSRARMVAIVLSPKQGTGRNGFRLKFDEANNLGRDASVDSVTAPTKTFLSGPETAATAVKTDDATSYTFSAVSFGAAASNRSIVVGIGGGRSSSGARNISSVTIGGVTATIAAEQDSPAASGSNVAGIAFAEVPTGTSGDIVVTWNATMSRCGIGVWSATDLGPVLDTGGDADDACADLTSTLVGSEGAVAFYHLYDEGQITGVSFSNATERYETLRGAWEGDGAQAGADYTFTSAGSVDVVATLASNGNDAAMMGVVFGRVGEHQFTPENTPTQNSDTPQTNYAVMTSLYADSAEYAEGATTAVTSGNDGDQPVGSIAFDSQDPNGYYFIMRPTTTSSTIGAFAVGVATVDHANITPRNVATNAGSWFFNCGNGNVTNTSGIANATWDSQSNGGISLNHYVQVAVKAGKIYFGVNNTWYDSSDGSFANAGHAFDNLTGMVVPMFQHAHASAGTVQVEFGAFGYTHAKPSGFKDITAAQLYAAGEPTIADPSAHCQAVTYTGNGTAIGSGGLSVNQDGNSTFQPDLVWIKNYDTNGNENELYDSVRGATKVLFSSTSGAESTQSEGLTAFESDGFKVGNRGEVNTSSDGHVAWMWKAADAFSESSFGSNGLASTGRRNTTAGFSIASWTHRTSANYAIKHGLSTTPEFFIIKSRDSGTNWEFWHKDLVDTGKRIVADNGAEITAYWADASDSADGTGSYADIGTGESPVTATLFGLQDGDQTGTDAMIGYYWHGIEGYSKFGTYTGNNNADGPYVNLGFEPAILILRRSGSSGDHWKIFDNKRNTVNIASRNSLKLNANQDHSNAGTRAVDFLSNGFKLRHTDAEANASGGTYIYAAWAHRPFFNVTPNTAN